MPSNDLRPRIVLSGVNIREVGGLSVFRDALTSLTREYGDRYEIVALVMRRDLYDIAGVTYFEFPNIMRSWLARVRFEYWTARGISARLKPKLWLSMHDCQGRSKTRPVRRSKSRPVV